MKQNSYNGNDNDTANKLSDQKDWIFGTHIHTETYSLVYSFPTVNIVGMNVGEIGLVTPRVKMGILMIPSSIFKK